MAGSQVPVIALDGPGGAGKGTISRAVAQRLDWHLLDSGALYRLVALAASRRGVDLADEGRLADVARNLAARFEATGGVERILLAGENVTAAVRSEETGKGASVVARLPGVRQALLQRQRDYRQPPGLVADGRDMGSVVFPDARLKIFLTASVDERARRRHKQLKEKGIDVSLPALSRDMAERDRRDSERSVAPLRPADGARVLDTTDMSIEQVIRVVLGWASEVF